MAFSLEPTAHTPAVRRRDRPGTVHECGGLSTPAPRSPTGHPLTERQREIVELAVAGMSNKDIAKKLYMSVRSVEGHLYRDDQSCCG